jgi:hypothetical protein
MLKPRVPEKLRDLVTKFQINEAHYKSAEFLETQVRVEFINPLLRLLGWDIDNEAGHAQEYKDVIHELHIGGKRHIDYAFKIGGSYKFIIEAKRPAADIADDAYPVYQARKYAHDTKIRLVIVTDFEEFAIYEGYSKYDRAPEPTDGVEYRRVFYCRYTEYLRYWSFLYSLISRKSVMLGLHDHLLARLEEVKNSIGNSVYTVREFNLLYSIAQSFGGEDYTVEQDIEIDQHVEMPASARPGPAVSAAEVMPIQFSSAPAQQPAFYLGPVFS